MSFILLNETIVNTDEVTCVEKIDSGLSKIYYRRDNLASIVRVPLKEVLVALGRVDLNK